VVEVDLTVEVVELDLTVEVAVVVEVAKVKWLIKPPFCMRITLLDACMEHLL